MARRPGLIDQTVDRLRQEIVSGAWPIGSRIPAEPMLSELVGVGRNTIREAVQSLVHAGMLERRQGSGTYVVSDSELAVAMSRQLADARQRDILEVRRSLEVEAVRLAARRRTAEDVAELDRLREAREKAQVTGDLELLVETDLALHRAIVIVARNEVLLALYDNVLGAISENIRYNFERPTADDEAHDRLVEAISRGEHDRAVDHITAYLSAMLERGEPRVDRGV